MQQGYDQASELHGLTNLDFTFDAKETLAGGSDSLRSRKSSFQPLLRHSTHYIGGVVSKKTNPGSCKIVFWSAKLQSHL